MMRPEKGPEMMPSVKHADLEGASVLVTGGATGIGAALVEGFASRARLWPSSTSKPAGAELAARLHARPARARSFSKPTCATSPHFASAAQAAAAPRTGHGARQQCGPRRPPRRRGSDPGILGRQPCDQPQAAVLRHPGRAARHEGGGRGAIVNFSSIAYMIHGTGYPAYAAAKAGVVGLTSSLAGELGPWGIRVNAIAPGAVLTERQRRLWVSPERFGGILERQCLKQNRGAGHCRPVPVPRLRRRAHGHCPDADRRRRLHVTFRRT